MMDEFFDSSDNSFPSFDLDTDRVNLFDLHAQVLRRNGRARLVRGGQACVLITQSELESLERALEIVSDSDAMRAVREQISLAAQLAATSAPPLEQQTSGAAAARFRSTNL